MSQLLTHALWILTALITLSASSANLLVNGSFEDPVVAASLSFTGAFSFTGWSGFSSITVDHPGNVAIVHGPALGLAPADGNQAFSFNGGNTTRGGASYVEQTLTGLSTTAIYHLSFALGRDNGSSTQALAMSVDLYSDTGADFSLGTFNVPTNGGYVVDTFVFNPSSSSTRIRFTEDSALNGTSDILLDNVAVTPFLAPEPFIAAPSAALLVFWLGRRRKW